jgi:hypothetical protein
MQDAVLAQFATDGGLEYFTSPDTLASHAEEAPAF